MILKKSELTQEEKLYLVISLSVHLYRVQFLFPWVCCDEQL